VKHLKKCYLFFIFLAVLIFTAKLNAQEGGTPEQEFPIGTFVYSNNAKLPGYNIDPDSGLNYVFYYLSGYYTRWEAESDNSNNLETGLKHDSDFGQLDYYKGVSCWSSKQNIGYKVNNFIWGPNYKQDKKHKWWSGQKVHYHAKYRLAFTGGGFLDPETVICTLKVVYKWKIKIGTRLFDYQNELGQKVIKKSDFPDDNFREDLFVEYNYGSPIVAFQTINGTVPEIGTTGDLVYIDDIPETGIEFRIDYEGIGKLYVDYIEVYDRYIWKDYIDNPALIENRIREYCNQFTKWDKESWFENEEPNTIDQHTPFRIIKLLIQSHDNNDANNRIPLSNIIYRH
jgi:hypothetical protein